MAEPSELILSARGYADSTVQQAKAAIDKATERVLEVGYLLPAIQPVDLPALPPTDANLVAPTLDTVTLDLPVEPVDNTQFQPISPVEAGTAPVFAVVKPTLSTLTQPSALPDFTATMPTINSALAFPTVPAELNNPTGAAPSISDAAFIEKPLVVLPVFDGQRPADDIAAPTDLDVRFDGAYRNAAPQAVAMMDGYVSSWLERYSPGYASKMAAMEDRLAALLAGGSGMSTAVENAIVERNKDRLLAEGRRVADAAAADWADRGFTLPGGALLASQRAARQAASDNLARAGVEIVVKQFELEQQNLQFAITTSADLRKALLGLAMNYHGNLVQINGQALDYAKNVVGAIVEVYNAAVRMYSLRLDGYRADAAIYETRLNGAMAGIELYKAEIQAEEARVNVDRARVDVYRARLDGLQALAAVFRSQIDAVLGQAQLERLKLDVFRTEVDARQAEVQAKNAEWQGYTAALQADEAKVRIYTAEVGAYGSQVQGYRAAIDAGVARVEAAAKTNDALARVVESRFNNFRTVVGARSEVARTKLENERQKVVQFDAQARAVEANFRVYNEYYRSTSTVAIENARLRLQTQLSGAESQRQFGTAIAQLGQAAASTFGHLAASSMAGMNSLAAETRTN